MSRWKISRVRVSWLTVVWITAVWVMLWGEVTIPNIVAGALIGLLVPALLPLPSFGFIGKVRPWGVVKLVFHFVVDLLVASFQVAFLALDPRHRPHSAVIGVQLRTESDLYLAFTAELATLVPGSVVVEAVRRHGMLYIHILDVDAMGGIEKARAHILIVEERIMHALASDSELRRAGMRGAK